MFGASTARPWIGPVVVGILLSGYCWSQRSVKGLLFIAYACAVGTVVDSFLATFNFLQYVANPKPLWLAPPWIIAMWANLAVILSQFFRYLSQRFYQTSVAGMFLGPLAYWYGAKLGSFEVSIPFETYVCLGLIWSVTLPLLVKLALRCSQDGNL